MKKCDSSLNIHTKEPYNITGNVHVSIPYIRKKNGNRLKQGFPNNYLHSHLS